MDWNWVIISNYLYLVAIPFHLHLHGVVNEGSNWGVLDFFLFLDNLV